MISPKLERSLTYSKPNDDQVARILRLREAAKVFGASIEADSSPSREQGYAIKAIEESLMWATKGVLLEEAPAATTPLAASLKHVWPFSERGPGEAGA